MGPCPPGVLTLGVSWEVGKFSLGIATDGMGIRLARNWEAVRENRLML